jgi:Cytoskeletal-regulatory complex EF hand
VFCVNRQLSDVNRDGALSLDEFCTAMHLVVLRRNDIELPDTLPPVLQPYNPLVTAGNEFNGSLKNNFSTSVDEAAMKTLLSFRLPVFFICKVDQSAVVFMFQDVA